MVKDHLADPRIPDPHTAPGLACRTNPDLFAYDQTPADADERRRVARAQRVCGGCPVVTQCLKWALANPALTLNGVWGATTPRQRTTLRRRLRERLGLDWVGVVADADRARALRETADQAAPAPAPAAHPMWSTPYTPAPRPLTAAQQTLHRQVLEAAQYTSRPRTPRTTETLVETR
ncbi:WhiB family transcriptional regulator [Streptomyces pseudovenezuelae]|uniref:WhiB family transcriptional regulator n=1 Tax=Streptomyces pseudovenezuelae TaxID=67350 RepID=UPI0036E10CC4